jgi:predicted DNA-binding protein
LPIGHSALTAPIRLRSRRLRFEPGRIDVGGVVLQLCYDPVVSSTTSSFRISDELRIRLESAASQSGKGKNWILTQALREYLERMREDSLAAEARRQSLLASARTTPEERFWAAGADDRHWI